PEPENPRESSPSMSHSEKRMKRHLVSGLLAMAVLLPAPAHAQQSLEERVAARVQGYLDSLHAATRVPGAQAGVVLPGGKVLAVSVGWADTARREPMTTTHKLLSGSVGKTYVAAIALRLVHEGKLRLDEPIATYLGQEPWFPRLPNAKDITVR